MTAERAITPAFASIDGNEAVARVAYRLSEVIALYPITPATPMGEWADQWRAQGRPNLWGLVPEVVQLQSEAGAAGSLHGALQAGALATTFTASQGLLLMVPNLYRLAGELTAAVLHVATRSLAAQALSIFGDHGDLMACRSTGCAILISATPQEAGDCAAIAMRATLHARVPFLHGFDGFRTSHEIQKLSLLSDAQLQELIPAEAIAAHRSRALSPAHPVLRGTAQNPDVYFQGRESVNRHYGAVVDHLIEAMERFAALTGRRYLPYAYQGCVDAQRVLVLMGSGCQAALEAAAVLRARGERVGVLQVRLFRPFATDLFVAALPPTTEAVAVLDRCKEPGAPGEPLYLDVVTAVAEAWSLHHRLAPPPRVIGGRYGLGSKEFTAAMAAAVLAELQAGDAALNHFTVGIDDDLSHGSLPWDPAFVCEAGQVRAVVHGLGSDGTVGANKAAIRIIGDCTAQQVQGYFVYDSKKAGSHTVSHLRFGPDPIRSTYLIQRPTLVACHQWSLLQQIDLLAGIVEGGVLLLNSPFEPLETWRRLPPPLRRQIRERQLVVWVINAYRVAREAGLGPRINTVMQVCFFAVSGVLPLDTALAQIRRSIEASYGHQGEAVVARNLQAVEGSLAQLTRLDWLGFDQHQQGRDDDQQPDGSAGAGQAVLMSPALTPDALSAFEREVILPLLAHQGDRLPVSAFPCDGTWPTGTARLEKRNLAEAVPVWQSDLCVQCGKCVMVCPHAAIRAKVGDPAAFAAAPVGYVTAPARDPDFAGQTFTIAVAPEDCTGCEICVQVCPARDRQQPSRKALVMQPQPPLLEQGRIHWRFFEQLPEVPRTAIHLGRLAQQQLLQPLFEFSGACAGCGETPYLKLLSQLFGDRLLVANATGCSSIYGGNLPTTPWSHTTEGRGPAWSNSLFEDNAEFGYGMRLALDAQRRQALTLLTRFSQQGRITAELAAAISQADESDEAGIAEQRQRLDTLGQQLRQLPPEPPILELLTLLDALSRTSVWLVGGDGWAYDIGFGGLDHVLASGSDVNVLVLDTEVYSNTGGQASKATPLGAVAAFASGGKANAKKDLGLMAMTYGHVYVASVAMGARDEHTLRAFLEAESYPGPSLILAYAHCTAHGIAMAQGMAHQKAAVDSGRWLLYRHDPRRRERGLNPLQLDMGSPHRALDEAMALETRFTRLALDQPQRAAELGRLAESAQQRRWALYRALADHA